MADVRVKLTTSRKSYFVSMRWDPCSICVSKMSQGNGAVQRSFRNTGLSSMGLPLLWGRNPPTFILMYVGANHGRSRALPPLRLDLASFTSGLARLDCAGFEYIDQSGLALPSRHPLVSGDPVKEKAGRGEVNIALESVSLRSNALSVVSFVYGVLYIFRGGFLCDRHVWVGCRMEECESIYRT